jgi:hypothetical protein
LPLRRAAPGVDVVKQNSSWGAADGGILSRFCRRIQRGPGVALTFSIVSSERGQPSKTLRRLWRTGTTSPRHAPAATFMGDVGRAFDAPICDIAGARITKAWGFFA